MNIQNSFLFRTSFFNSHFFAHNTANAQQQELSVSLSHPVTVGDTFFSDFSGLAGLDVEYAYPINDNFWIGGKLGYSRSKETTQITFYEQPSNSNPIYVISTSVFTRYSNLFKGQFFISPSINLDERLFLTPQLGLGYARINFNGENFQERSDNGINSSFSLSLELLIHDQFKMGIFSSYEFIHLEKSGDMPNTSFNRNMHFINLGAKLSIILNQNG